MIIIYLLLIYRNKKLDATAAATGVTAKDAEAAITANLIDFKVSLPSIYGRYYGI